MQDIFTGILQYLDAHFILGFIVGGLFGYLLRDRYYIKERKDERESHAQALKDEREVHTKQREIQEKALKDEREVHTKEREFYINERQKLVDEISKLKKEIDRLEMARILDKGMNKA